MNNNSKTRTIIKGIALGIAFVIIVCALATLFLTSVDWIYKLDMKLLDIKSYSGFDDEEMILRNYHATVRFMNDIFSKDPFTLPDLAVSEVGVIHFDDCRNITRNLYLLAVAALPVSIILILTTGKDNKKKLFSTSGITMLAIPAIILIAIAIDANGFFILFHKIFFSNDYWLFDWYLDEVIRILPEPFFIHCAVVIVVFWLMAAISSLLVSKHYKKS